MMRVRRWVQFRARKRERIGREEALGSLSPGVRWTAWWSSVEGAKRSGPSMWHGGGSRRLDVDAGGRGAVRVEKCGGLQVTSRARAKELRRDPSQLFEEMLDMEPYIMTVQNLVTRREFRAVRALNQWAQQAADVVGRVLSNKFMVIRLHLDMHNVSLNQTNYTSGLIKPL